MGGKGEVQLHEIKGERFAQWGGVQGRYSGDVRGTVGWTCQWIGGTKRAMGHRGKRAEVSEPATQAALKQDMCMYEGLETHESS